MKRKAEVMAEDQSGNSIKIQVTVQTPSYRGRPHATDVVRSAARLIASRVLPDISSTDFGADNTKVRI
jgi:hypothetical protein